MTPSDIKKKAAEIRAAFPAGVVKQLMKELDREVNPSITSKDAEIKALQEQVKKTAVDKKVSPTEVMTALLKALRIGGRIGRGLGDDGEKAEKKPRATRQPKAEKPAKPAKPAQPAATK